MDYMNPKSPSELPKPERLRRVANDLKGKAEKLLEEADALLAEAERLEKADSPKKKSREDFSQAAARIVREATKD
jgi:hypothetical protein